MTFVPIVSNTLCILCSLSQLAPPTPHLSAWGRPLTLQPGFKLTGTLFLSYLCCYRIRLPRCHRMEMAEARNNHQLKKRGNKTYDN